MIDLRNSCGGTGCNVPEHEKRTGTDALFVNRPTRIGDLVEASRKMNRNYQDVKVVPFVAINPPTAN